jgi:hypothetical protein
MIHDMTITELADYRPKHLGPEPWGKRFARARGSATIRVVEDVLDSEFSRATITRLESLTEAPTKQRDRRRAYMLVVLYGYDPADFGLTDDDRPPVVNLRALRDLGERWLSWTTHHPIAA